MKIKTLEFEAFGPYTKRQFLDFSSLNEAELFLVTGDTGAGKTTIFDAICFALYGVSSGDVRQISQFRSQKAGPQTETYVKMSFEVRGQTYTITRYPNYLREGYKTETRHRAYLDTEDKKHLEGVSEVNNRIKEILGVDADEFRQVAMIAQGKFTTLIHAQSKEREAIFRELFSTQAYALFQENLKKAEKAQKEKYLEKKMKLDTYLEELGDLNGKDPLDFLTGQSTLVRETLESLATDKKEKSQSLKQVETQLEIGLQRQAWKNQLASLVNREEELANQKEAMQQLKEKVTLLSMINRLKPYYEKFLTTQKTLTEITKRLANCKAKDESLQEQLATLLGQSEEMAAKEKAVFEMSVQLEKVNEDLNKAERFEKAKNLARKASQQVEACQLAIQSSQSQKEELETILKKCQEDLEQLSSLETLKVSLTHQSNTLKIESTRIEQLQKANQKLKQLQLDFDKQQEIWETLSQQQRVQSDYQLQLEKQYQANLAGLLAKDLEEDKPCPVCGSLHHPSPAKLSFEDITPEKIEASRQETLKIAASLQQAFGDLMSQKQALEIERKNYADSLENRDLAQIIALYQKECLDFESARKDYMEKSERRDRMEEALKTYQTRFEVWQQKDAKFQDDLLKANENLQNRNEQFLLLRGSFHEQFESLEVLLKKQAKLKREINQSNQELTHFEKQKTAFENDRQKTQGELSALKQQMAQAKEALETAMTDYQSRLENSGLSQTELQNYIPELSQLERIQEACLDYEQQCFALQSAKQDLYNHLASSDEVDVEALREEKRILDEALEKITLESQRQQWLLDKMTQQRENITASQKAYEASQKKYQEIFEISRLVSGQNQARITFESYILAAYFEAVLERANLRFVAMTNGRYVLLRRELPSSGRALQGLDLDVIDYESGKARDVRTLSGGETFKAALSLALGMADLISENAGGIELDTLFIDEGFGSLDEKSLDMALDTLIELKQEHKVVGIISHVAQLKERVPAKIWVTHQENTSVAKIS